MQTTVALDKPKPREFDTFWQTYFPPRKSRKNNMQYSTAPQPFWRAIQKDQKIIIITILCLFTFRSRIRDGRTPHGRRL